MFTHLHFVGLPWQRCGTVYSNQEDDAQHTLDKALYKENDLFIGQSILRFITFNIQEIFNGLSSGASRFLDSPCGVGTGESPLMCFTTGACLEDNVLRVNCL